MKRQHPYCRNCHVSVVYGFLCSECVRIAIISGVGTLLGAIAVQVASAALTKALGL